MNLNIWIQWTVERKYVSQEYYYIYSKIMYFFMLETASFNTRKFKNK